MEINKYMLLADLTAIVHLAYILFVLAGQGLILIGWVRGWHWTRGRIFRMLHLAAIGLVVIEALSGIFCPLTLLENYLRVRSGDALYSSSFIGYWTDALIYYTAPEWVFTLVYSVFFIVVVVTFIAYPPRSAKNNGRAGCDD